MELEVARDAVVCTDPHQASGSCVLHEGACGEHIDLPMAGLDRLGIVSAVRRAGLRWCHDHAWPKQKQKAPCSNIDQFLSHGLSHGPFLWVAECPSFT